MTTGEISEMEYQRNVRREECLRKHSMPLGIGARAKNAVHVIRGFFAESNNRHPHERLPVFYSPSEWAGMGCEFFDECDLLDDPPLPHVELVVLHPHVDIASAELKEIERRVSSTGLEFCVGNIREWSLVIASDDVTSEIAPSHEDFFFV